MSKASKVNPLIQVGRRFVVDDADGSKQRGTVRYLGPVFGSKDETRIYAGVEWDELGRGKHNGTSDGKQYFTCPEGQGSFIHPKRIQLGCTLVEALKAKYAEDNDVGECLFCAYLIFSLLSFTHLLFSSTLKRIFRHTHPSSRFKYSNLVTTNE